VLEGCCILGYTFAARFQFAAVLNVLGGPHRNPTRNNEFAVLFVLVVAETYFNKTVVEIDTQQFFCPYVRIRCRGNLFNKTLPSN
jgi:hypothetical protein